MKQYIALAYDNGGIPRAWGTSPDSNDAWSLAKIELEEYRATRNTRWQEPFRIEVKELEEAEEVQG